MTTHAPAENALLNVDARPDIHAQTYHRFTLGVKIAAVHLAALGAFLVLWLATPAGFGWGLLAGLAIAGCGAYALTHGLQHSSIGNPETWSASWRKSWPTA